MHVIGKTSSSKFYPPGYSTSWKVKITILETLIPQVGSKGFETAAHHVWG